MVDSCPARGACVFGTHAGRRFSLRPLRDISLVLLFGNAALGFLTTLHFPFYRIWADLGNAILILCLILAADYGPATASNETKED